MANSGYLGGNVSMAERYRLRDIHLHGRPRVDKGWRSQCRCGGIEWIRWRGRWYCPTCARWVREFPEAPAAPKETDSV